MLDHLFLMLWHALLVSVFFAFLWRRSSRDRLQLFGKAFLIRMNWDTRNGGIEVSRIGPVIK